MEDASTRYPLDVWLAGNAAHRTVILDTNAFKKSVDSFVGALAKVEVDMTGA
jgi:hypothetical protein